MRRTLKAPRSDRLKLKYDVPPSILLSNSTCAATTWCTSTTCTPRRQGSTPRETLNPINTLCTPITPYQILYTPLYSQYTQNGPAREEDAASVCGYTGAL